MGVAEGSQAIADNVGRLAASADSATSGPRSYLTPSEDAIRDDNGGVDIAELDKLLQQSPEFSHGHTV